LVSLRIRLSQRGIVTNTRADSPAVVARHHPLLLLTPYDKYGMVPTNDVLTGPLFVMQDTAKQVIELSAQGYR
jgi:hypothetical protein